MVVIEAGVGLGPEAEEAVEEAEEMLQVQQERKIQSLRGRGRQQIREAEPTTIAGISEQGRWPEVDFLVNMKSLKMVSYQRRKPN